MSGVIWATFGRFSSEFVRARAEPPAKLARRRPGKQFACGFGNHRMFQGMPLVRSLRLRDIVYWGNREKDVSKGWLVDSPKCIFFLKLTSKMLLLAASAVPTFAPVTVTWESVRNQHHHRRHHHHHHGHHPHDHCNFHLYYSWISTADPKTGKNKGRREKRTKGGAGQGRHEERLDQRFGLSRIAFYFGWQLSEQLKQLSLKLWHWIAANTGTEHSIENMHWLQFCDFFPSLWGFFGCFAKLSVCISIFV